MRHFFVRDEDGNCVGKFDIDSKKARKKLIENLPDDLSVDLIELPREDALELLISEPVDWDRRLDE